MTVFIYTCENVDLEGCVEYEGEKCARCEAPYYLNSVKTCNSSTVVINGCYEKSGESTCRQCFEGFILSKDKKACSSNNFDNNCIEEEID